MLIAGGVVLAVLGGLLVANDLQGGEDAPPPPPHRAAPNWVGQYQEAGDLCQLVDVAPFRAIADKLRAEQTAEEPEFVYDSTKLVCPALLFNTGANAGEAENARNLRLWTTAYIKQGSDPRPHSELYDKKVVELKESTPDLLTDNDGPMDTMSGEIQGVGDQAFFTFAAGRERLNLAYEGVYSLVVLHGNLILQVEAYVMREDPSWRMEEIDLATRDVVIGVMERLRAG